MNKTERADQAPDEVPSPGPTVAIKSRQSLAKSRRELTEEEQAQSGVRLMLLDEIDRLDVEVTQLAEVRENFHAADKRVAVLEENRRQRVALEILYSVGLSLGVGLVMLSPTITEKNVAYTSAGVGIILVICAILAKVYQK